MTALAIILEHLPASEVVLAILTKMIMTRSWVYAHGLFGCALVLVMWCVDRVSQAVLLLCCSCVCHTLFEATLETDHSETHVKEIHGSCLKIRVSKTLKHHEAG